MKRRTLHRAVFRDDGGQALTEFVIVIPVVLLFFFAMLQYFATFQASQLGNYAAYVAARVYAVRASIDANDAKDKAQQAASMVLAPIAAPAAGELSVGGLVPNFGVINTLMGNKLSKFGIGYAMAQFGRFDVLGGGITFNLTGNPQQVDCTINYPQPIFLPGLASLWNFVTGDKVYTSMKPLRQGLNGVIGTVLPVYEGDEQAQKAEQQLSQFNLNLPQVPNLPDILMPYVNVKSKCSMGYEDWQLDNGGPRLPAKGDEPDGSGQSNNQQLQNQQQQLQQAQQAQQNYQNAVSDAKRKCQDLCTADANLSAAHAKDDPIINDPKASAQAKANAQTDLDDAQQKQQQAESANSTAQSNLNNSADAVNQLTGQDLPAEPCNCN
jgi:hypothetical protein